MASSYQYTAVMVEPRKHKAIEFVLNNYLSCLDTNWCIKVMVGNHNVQYVNNIVEKLQESDRARVEVLNLRLINLNSESYSQFLGMPYFYSHIPTETFLVFQTDSMIVPQYKDKLNRFLQYEYVGAPWNFNNQVGNGGVSLRNKSKMLEIIAKQGPIRCNEDIYFSRYQNCKKPTAAEAREFAVETIFYKEPFALHNCWNHISKEDLEYYKKTVPGLTELIKLQATE